ncbi:MAG: type II toxin-antitoxin system death-on-curing family toxin [Thermomicrobiales bacterium]
MTQRVDIKEILERLAQGNRLPLEWTAPQTMADDDDNPLIKLLRRLPILPAERIFFARTDPETTHVRVQLLTAASYCVDAAAVADFGGRGGPARDRGLVEQVIAAAFQTFGDFDPHPTVFEKAAMLLRGITQGHPFNDDNKRTGFLVAVYFLDLVGHALPSSIPADEAVDLCFRVSAGDIRDVEKIASEIERLWTSFSHN